MVGLGLPHHVYRPRNIQPGCHAFAHIEQHHVVGRGDWSATLIPGRRSSKSQDLSRSCYRDKDVFLGDEAILDHVIIWGGVLMAASAAHRRLTRRASHSETLCVCMCYKRGLSVVALLF